jgi:hypothetical protein
MAVQQLQARITEVTKQVEALAPRARSLPDRDRLRELEKYLEGLRDAADLIRE